MIPPIKHNNHDENMFKAIGRLAREAIRKRNEAQNLERDRILNEMMDERTHQT